MANCDECGKHENLPYQCRRCGQTFCGDHRLPENHNCPGLNEWNDPAGIFDSGFDDSVRNQSGRSSGLVERLTSTGGPISYFRGNVAYLFLAIMWVVFALEFVVIFLAPQLFTPLFVLTPAHPEYVWTWLTSVFSHSPRSFLHIVGNSIVLYFFGPLVERYIGSKKFAALFIVSGMVAGLGNVGVSLLTDPTATAGVLGASGAIFAVLGVLTVLNPKLKIYLYFLLPVPLWLFTLAFAGFSVLFLIEPATASAAGQGNVAHFAHLAGLVIGLAYGRRVKGKQRVPSQLQFGGRGGMGGPGRGRF